MAQMQPPNNSQSGFQFGIQANAPPYGAPPPLPSSQSPYPPQMPGIAPGQIPYPSQPPASGQGPYPYPPQQQMPITSTAYPVTQGSYQPVASSAPPMPQSSEADLPLAPAYPGAPPLPSNAQQLPTQPLDPNFVRLPGFADAGFDPIIQPPANPYFDPSEPLPSYERQLPSSVAIFESEVKAAVEKFVNDHCCYGKPEPLKINEITMKSAFKYQLGSYTEERQTVWKTEPYINQMLEGPPMGRMLGPWEYQLSPAEIFKDETRHLKIPNTTSVQPCHTCHGYGRVRCTHCDGFGTRKCTWCHGSGKRFDENCKECNASGRQRCTWCHGMGLNRCKACDGKGQLFFYLELIVNWKNNVDEYISGSTIIPKDLLSKTESKQVILEKNKRLAPLANLPDSALNNASRDLIQKHGQAYSSQSLILEQKQSVDIIRIAEVNYTWKDKSGIFHVFGDNNDVYFPEYPSQCCGCCTIM